jgi:hypothetical protein
VEALPRLWPLTSASLLALLCACGPADEPPLTPDAGATVDGGADGGVSGTDAGADAGWGACTTGTAQGECLHVDDCGVGSQPVAGFCPGPAEIQCCVALEEGACAEDPPWEDMPRPNEGLVEAAGDIGCPAGMATVDGFCVDRHEASLVEILTDGGVRSWSPFFNPEQRRVRAVSIAGAVPQGYISGAQAQDACAEAGKRLCTDAEWVRACEGPSGTTYPYGDTRVPGACNDARAVHPAVDYFDSTDDSIWSMLDNGCINQQEDSLDATGTNAQCVSADGAFDMMGNLHEWTSDSAGTFRGGFYADTVVNGDGCTYVTTAHGFSYWDYSTGFRCCADPS